VAVEFDPAKDEANKRKHRLSLILAQRVFEGPFIEEQIVRAGLSEPRFIAIGPVASLGNRICVTIYTWRQSNRRVISFRKANDREIRRYHRDYP